MNVVGGLFPSIGTNFLRTKFSDVPIAKKKSGRPKGSRNNNNDCGKEEETMVNTSSLLKYYYL